MTNPENTNLKLCLINSLYFDILILPETHCLLGQTLIIDNYIVYQHNRSNQGNARKGSGGIAIAIHWSILNSHSVVSVVKGDDGQLAVVLKNRYNDFTVGILALYLPPEGYVYGRDPEMFFNKAAIFWDSLADCDLVVGGGVLNSRTKELPDYIPDIDGQLVPKRHNPDKFRNKHGDSFITFLKDQRSVILNGRITP